MKCKKCNKEMIPIDTEENLLNFIIIHWCKYCKRVVKEKIKDVVEYP